MSPTDLLPHRPPFLFVDEVVEIRPGDGAHGRWRLTGHEKSLAYEPWPEFDPALVKDDAIEIGVQINGKARASVLLPIDADEAAAKELALADPKVQSFVLGKAIKKVIYVKGRILNLIVG